MKKTLILTPNRNSMCGMFQLAKDLAKEFDGEVWTKGQKIPNEKLWEFKQVITLMYPMHKHGKFFKGYCGIKWICYNQGIPPITKTYFPNFWRRHAMRYINWRNNATMKGADEYWDVTEREQKPRWTEKIELTEEMIKNVSMLYSIDLNKPYSIYLGRTTDYKNYESLQRIMKELDIPLFHPLGVSDENVWMLLSNAQMYVSMSLWEGVWAWSCRIRIFRHSSSSL